MSKRTGSAHVVVIIILVVALVAALGFIFWQNFVQKDSAKTTDTTADSSKQTDTTDDSDTVATGTMTGKAVYPSEAYPDDFKVCALNSTTKKEIVCDATIIKGKYSFDLTPGEYFIVAKTDVMEGYYDAYMKSGMKSDICEAKNIPLAVTVTAGNTVNDIDAGDFYYVADNC